MAAGTAIEASFFQKTVSPVMFVLVMLCYNHFQFSVTPFAFTLALTNAVISNLIMFFSIKALSMGSVANYTLHLLCGGMVLPVVYGALIGDEFGVWKIASLVLILAAIGVKMDRKEKTGKLALLCFSMLFILNGLVGVVSSMHQGDLFDFKKVSSVEFIMLNSTLTMLLGAVVFGMIAIKKRKAIKLKAYAKASPWAMCDGVLNGVANLLLLLSLKELAPSLQYPIVTGGTIFLSAVFGLLVYKEKPTARVWCSVALAVVGTVVMAVGDLCF